MKHELKIWPQYYARVADETKTFELRNNDRGFQCGDTVVLNYFDPKHENAGMLSHRDQELNPPLTFTIGYVLPVDEHRVVFSLLKSNQEALENE